MYHQFHFSTVNIILIDCKTNAEGPSKNVPCIFPFNFKTKDHRGCVWDDKGPWCSTKIDKYAIHVGGSRGYWGYCNPQCPTERKPEGL